MRGRISSLAMLYPAMISVGAFVAGPLSDLLGVRGASARCGPADRRHGALPLLDLLREMRFK